MLRMEAENWSFVKPKIKTGELFSCSQIPRSEGVLRDLRRAGIGEHLRSICPPLVEDSTR